MLCKYQKHVLIGPAVSILTCCLALVVWSAPRSVGITMEVTFAKSDGPPPAGNGNSSEPLILGVDTRRFLAEIGASTPEKMLLGLAGVHYLFLQPQAGGAKDITLGVYPSVERTKEKYQEYLAGAAGPLIPMEHPSGIGDQFKCWIVDDTPGTLLLRRRNVLFVASFSGGREKAIEFARKVDGILLHSHDICPKGTVVPTPEVELIAPQRVALGSTVPIKYKSKKTMLIRTEPDPRLHLEGEFHFDARELGEQTAEFVFASSKNVMFTKSLTIEVVPPEELSLPGTIEAWDWPGHRLYFTRTPEQEWSAISSSQQEWLNLRHSTFGPLRDAEDWKRKALNDLAGLVQGRWLPTMETIQAYENCARPTREKVYYASFKTEGYNVIYMGTIGKGFLLYIEQPDLLPEGHKQPAEDVLRDDLLQSETNDRGETSYPRVQFMVRTFDRYRAYQPEGPYEPVHILLADVRFSNELNLKFPGYR